MKRCIFVFCVIVCLYEAKCDEHNCCSIISAKVDATNSTVDFHFHTFINLPHSPIIRCRKSSRISFKNSLLRNCIDVECLLEINEGLIDCSNISFSHSGRPTNVFPSFALSPFQWSNFILQYSAITNLVVEDYSYLFKGMFAYNSMKFNCFSNISSNFLPKQNEKNESLVSSISLETIIKCSNFRRADENLNWIMPTQRSQYKLLKALNSTFVECKHSLNSGTREMLNETTILNDCSWSDCSAEGLTVKEANGGAIYLYGNGTADLSINNCTFSNCSSLNSGGAIYADNVGTINVNESRFMQCQAGNFGGSISVRDIQTKYSYCFNNFENCTALIFGGAVYFKNYTANNQVNMNVAKNCSSSSYGGGFMHHDSDYPAPFFNTLTMNCSSITGGGLYLFFQKIPQNSEIQLFFFCAFFNNTAESGNDIRLYNKDNLTDELNPTVGCLTTSVENQVCMWATEEEIVNWIPTTLESRLVNFENGLDIDVCGLEIKKCRTIGFTVTQARPSTNFSIILESALIKETQIIIGENIVCISRKNETFVPEIECCSTNGSFFQVGTGSLKIENIVIVLSQNASPEITIFHSTNSGELIIHNCIIKGSCPPTSNSLTAAIFSGCNSKTEIGMCNVSSFFLSGKPVFDIKPCSLQAPSLNISNTTFSDISRKTGSGCIFEKVIESDELFSVNDVIIEDCTTEDGNGGGFWIESNYGSSLRIGVSEKETSFSRCSCKNLLPGNGYGGGMYLKFDKGASDFIVTSTSFTECSASKGGSNIFIECWCLKELINATSLNFSREDMLNRDLMGFEEGNENAPIELEAFFVEFNGTGYVCGDNGCDFSGCGTYSYPCASLSHLISLRFELIDRNIIINSIVTLEEAIEMNDFECEMTGVTTTTQFDVYPSSSISSGNVISIRNNANLINLCFSLHPSFSSASAFIKFVPSIEEDKLLRIFSCSFSGISGSEISYAIISSTNGKITISECTLSELLSSSSLMLFESTVEINQSHFRDTCAPSSVKGGALSVYLKKGQCFSLNESSSNNCECSNTSGKGGFVYLNAFLSILEEPFLFKTCSFEGNSAFLGKNIFLEVNNLSKSVSMNTLNINFDGMNYDENLLIGNDIIFTKPIDLLHFFIPRVYSNVYLSTVSFDLIGCGSVDVPCKSFGKAINQRDMNLSEWTIYVGDTAIINDHFNLSNCFLKPKLQENNKDSVRFYLQSHASTGEVPSMSNEGSLSFLDIAFRIEAVGTNTLKTIVINSGDLLSFAHCSFENVGNEADQNDYSIVIMKKGKLQIDDISIQNNKNKKDAFVISFGCESAFNNLEIISSFIDEGGAIRIGADQESFHNEQIIITHILINGSTFRSIERSNKGASVIQSEKEGEQVDLNINDTSFESCSAPSSTRGGAVMFSLHEGRSLRITDSTFTQCNCSYSNGRGGALFISAKSHKELDFLLNRVSFAYNLAHVGWNVFVECYNISSQINETQFKLDFRTIPSQLHLFSGCDTTDHTDDTDLMQFITIYQDSTIVVSNAPNKSSTNSRLCGSYEQPCISLGYALEHLVHTFESRLMIDQQTFIESEIDLKNLSMHALSTEQSNVSFSSDLSKTRDSLLNTFSRVIIESISFKFSPQTHLMHNVIFYAVNGSLKILSSTFESTDLTSIAFASQLFRISAASLIMEKVRYQLLSLHSIVNFQVESSSLSISDIILSSLILSDNAINFFKISETTFVTNVRVFNTSLLGGSIIYFHSSGNAHLEVSKHTRTSFSLLNFANISSAGPSGCAVFIEKLTDAPLDIINCSFNNCSSSSEKGNTISIHSSKDILFSSCSISGSNDLPETDEKNHETNEKFGEICKWSGSLVDAVNSSVALKDTTIENSSTGGMTISGGNILVEKGEFINNSPSVEKYPSVRRNIICADSGELNVISYKNGDGLMNDTSFWILNEGCQLKGIISDVSSVLFIPSLRHVKAVEEDDVLKLNCTGSLLLPCGLSLLFITKVEDLHIKENYTFGDEDYVSETEVHANIPSSAISSAPAEAEVFISIQFGGLSSSSTTAQWILKNKTEVQTNLTDNIVKGEKSSSSLWIIIVIVMSVILFIILIIAVAFIVRWKKAKRRTEELEVIVEDTVRKDPKLIEMMTMEMSPEEQWRRTKREEAKKNEERIKKRVYEKTIQHSESSEYLLSESGSTEYILGRDSDKIPEWVLEKVDEKEEDVISRKRTPSPSISSTSTTDTSDTESTFVRSESLCPTTSSMSNLVDAMACSSPHEKLIVDLRDSLFMLLHGRNEKKEMAIDTLQEREQTAAQILFWVANLALHSFDEMDNPLSSLANLSPHIVLFSEHMVIAIAMHSDCSSDSDSSSISSASTIVSSSSDQKSSNRNGKSSPPPSSAFEDDEDNRKECMRWKAPELMINRNATASKKTVSFSIGMMLWECLTLQIPFGEYEAEVAGQKIVNGERPSLEAIDSSTYFESVRSCLSENYDDRQSLIRLKREFIQHFPAGAVIMTVSDAVDFAISGRDKKSDYASTEAEDLSCSSFF